MIWTVGHSSRTIEEFLALLQSQAIEVVADVRRYAGSRAYPHFNSTPLAQSLSAQRVAYVPFPELGGRRMPRPESHNTIWRNVSFRGYADYMETSGYRAGVDRLLGAAVERRTALLCAEALWWRCHRALIADDLKARGILVLHVMGLQEAVEHPFTSAAQIADGKLVYGPAPSPSAGDTLLKDA